MVAGDNGRGLVAGAEEFVVGDFEDWDGISKLPTTAVAAAASGRFCCNGFVVVETLSLLAPW
jgi:hypothetical protein